MSYARNQVARVMSDGKWYSAQQVANKLDLSLGHVRELLKIMRQRKEVRAQREPGGMRYLYSLSTGQTWESWLLEKGHTQPQP